MRINKTNRFLLSVASLGDLLYSILNAGLTIEGAGVPFEIYTLILTYFKALLLRFMWYNTKYVKEVEKRS